MAKEQTEGTEPVKESAKAPNPQYVPSLRKEYDFSNLSDLDKAELKQAGVTV